MIFKIGQAELYKRKKKVPKYNQIYYMVQWRTVKYVPKY